MLPTRKSHGAREGVRDMEKEIYMYVRLDEDNEIARLYAEYLDAKERLSDALASEGMLKATPAIEK
mgnify:FL=1